MGIRAWTCAAALAVGLVATAPAAAQGPAAVRKQVESSVLVTGTIDLRQDGTVAGHAIDHRDRLPEGVAAMVDRHAGSWRFEPIVLDRPGQVGRAKMSVRVVARRLDDGNYLVRLAGANFGTPRDGDPAERVSAAAMAPPRYPQDAARAGVSGTVYTALKIGRDGRVEDAIAEQVNLRYIDSESGMQRWRDRLARAALARAQEWTFRPPPQGEDADDAFWSVRVPVDFELAGDTAKRDEPGRWEAYVPGPRQASPWATEPDHGGDALVAGGVYPVGGGLRLLTPLGGS